MPMVDPGASKRSALANGDGGDAVGLRGAPGVEFLRQFGVMSREQRGGEQAGIGRACLADREGRDGDAAGHLDDRKQAVMPPSAADWTGTPSTGTRSDERRVGQEGVRQGRAGGAP